MEPLEAEEIFLVVGRHVTPSHTRNAEWLTGNLNRPLTFKRFSRMEDLREEIQLVSAVPVSPPEDWDYDTAHEYSYLITETTMVHIFAQTYSVTFCLDISPSMAAVVKPSISDMDEVPLDRIYSSLKSCLRGLARHFILPGSNLILTPDIYVSVIVHVPFVRSGHRQVLAQGWLLSEDGLDNFLAQIGAQLCDVEDDTAKLTAAAHHQREVLKSHHDPMVGTLFDSEDGTSSEPVAGLNSPEHGLLDILRYCLLGFQLVPDYCCPAIIVISDDVFGSAKSDVLDSFLNQLRLSWVTCSFIGLGSEVRPNLAFGDVPYKKLMRFVAATTGGTYLPAAPVVELYDYSLPPNECHLSFLRRSFQMIASNELLIKSPIFAIERWKHIEYKLELDAVSLIACRLKEGFFLKSISFKDEDGILELQMALLWRTDVTIEYVIRSPFPCGSPGIACEIYVVGPYEFLHDITCKAKKPIKSQHRLITFQQYWLLMKNIKETDQVLLQLYEFTSDPAHYSVPDGVKSGIPLLYIPPNTIVPSFYSSEVCTTFCQFWRMVSMLEFASWSRWFHVHRIDILLEHDIPLSKSLQSLSTGDKYRPIVYCRASRTALNGVLAGFASFTLVDNSSYVGFCKREDDRSPRWFYVIRLASKPPCVVVKIGFLRGAPYAIRCKVVEELHRRISQISLAQHPHYKESSGRSHHPSGRDVIATDGKPEYRCCYILEKPLEKILVKYERQTKALINTRKHQPASSRSMKSQQSRNESLSRFLEKRHWVWMMHSDERFPLEEQSVARILAVLVKLRLSEGFRFAVCSDGVITMALELTMQLETPSWKKELQLENDKVVCLVQYVLFPPQVSKRRDSGSDEDLLNSTRDGSLTRASSSMNIECWIEPQSGNVISHDQFTGLTFDQISEKIHTRDVDCVSTLVTLDYLIMMCQKRSIPPPLPANSSSSVACVESPKCGRLLADALYENDEPYDNLEDLLCDHSIRMLPFCYAFESLLQTADLAELLFSSLTQEMFPTISDVENSLEAHESYANQTLYDLLNRQISKISDRELILSDGECKLLFSFIKNRSRTSCSYPCPLTLMMNDLYVDSELPRWRCYIKNPGGSKVVLICVPKTLLDLKMLMVNCVTVSNGDGISFKKLSTPSDKPEFNRTCQASSFSTVDDERLSSVLSQQIIDAELTKTSSRKSSFNQTPNDTLLKNLTENAVQGQEEQQFRRRFGSLDPTAFHSQSSEETSFLKRTSSDVSPMKSVASKRTKRLNNTESSYGLAEAVSTPSTLHTYQVNERATPVIDKMEDESSFPKPEPGITGSYTIPVYVFECSRAEVVSQILQGRTDERPKDVFKDLTFSYYDGLQSNEQARRRRSESLAQREDDMKQFSPDLNSEETETSGDKVSLGSICEKIEGIFPRCYVEATFLTLQQELKTYARDVLIAVDLCEEVVVEIDITELLMKICNHIDEYSGRTDHNDLSELEGEAANADHCSLPLESLLINRSCRRLAELQKEIRERFNQMLGYSFQRVPSQTEFFYFCPPDYQPSKVNSTGTGGFAKTAGAENGLSFTQICEITTRTDKNEDWIEFEHDPNVQSVPAFETESLMSESDVSNASNVGSESPIPPDELNEMSSTNGRSSVVSGQQDLISPLFLHLTSSFRVKNYHGVQPVLTIPTCFGEILSGLANVPSEVCLKTLKVTLDILCLSSPTSERWFQSGAECRTISFCSDVSGVTNSSGWDGHDISEDLIYPGPQDSSFDGVAYHRSYKLPAAVLKMVEEIRWMIKDELVGLLLDDSEVNRDTLERVISHVENSPGRPSCCKSIESLKFVLGADKSFELFKQEFLKLKLDEYGIEQLEDYFYVVKTEIGDELERTHSREGSNEASEDTSQSSPTDADSSARNVSVHSLSDQSATPNAQSVDDFFGRMDSIRCSSPVSGPEKRNSDLPPFWMVFRVEKKAVISYFHCRVLQGTTADFRSYEQTRQAILKKVDFACDFVNRRMLLQNLHDSRKCNNLLEMDSEISITSDSRAASMDFDLVDDNQKTVLAAEMKFNPGCFACPVVWETHFELHKRLKAGRGQVGLGLQALMAALHPFSVVNRKNMYVYQDEMGNVFYMRLFEWSTPEAETLSVARFQITNVSPEPRSRKVSKQSNLGEEMTGERDSVTGFEVHGDCIHLRVHGITEAGPAIKKELMDLLRNRLDEAVLSILYRLLARNPHCKLNPEDVRFLQSTGEQPVKRYQFTLPSAVLPFTAALEYCLRESLATVFTQPKYTDSQIESHFRDYSQDPVPECHIFMAVRTPEISQSWVGVVAFTFVDGQGNPLSSVSGLDFYGFRAPLNPSEIPELLKTAVHVDNEERKGPGPLAMVEFRLWERGTRHEDKLVCSLSSCIRHALWDVFTEQRMLIHPLCYPSENQGFTPIVPLSEPDTPVHGNQHELADPRARSVSFGGSITYMSPCIEQSSNQVKSKSRHTSGIKDRAVSPVASTQQANLGAVPCTIPLSPRPEAENPRRLFRTTSAVANAPSKSTSNLHTNKGSTQPDSRSLSPSTAELESVIGGGASSVTPPVSGPPLTPYDLGERGILGSAYGTTLKNWFDYGLQNEVPSLKSQSFHIASEHLVPIILKTFQGLIVQVHSGLSMRVFWNQGGNLNFFVPFSLSSNVQRTLKSTHIVTARITELWKEGLKQPGSQDSEKLKSFKTILKYQPFFLERQGRSTEVTPSENVSQNASVTTSRSSGLNLQLTCHDFGRSLYISRQAFILAYSENKKITLYSYNISKDFFRETGNLIKWENARWLLYTTIVEQKLGLFYNLPLLRRNIENAYSACDVDALVRNQPPSLTRESGVKFCQAGVKQVEVFRDRKPPNLLWKAQYKNDPDPVRKFGCQMQETRSGSPSETIGKIESLWKSSGASSVVSVTEDVIEILLGYGRPLHYCLTPLLFLPKWRLQVAATRDPSLATLQNEELLEGPRSRASSGSQSDAGATARRMTDDKWHGTLCMSFLQEYIYYLENMGFVRIDVQPLPLSKSRHASTSSRTSEKPEVMKQQKIRCKTEESPIYLKKSSQGGIIVCEIEIKPPFFSTKLIAVESCRFKGTKPFLSFGVVQKFIDECDQIKVLLHLHSFTYDYHLRSIHMYVTGKQSPIKQGYHLVSFLDDFTKYYNKGPNFARNLVYAGSVSFEDPILTGRQLYDYILGHERSYGFKVLRMSPLDQAGETEYILVRTLTNVPVRSIQEQRNVPDGYDATLIVSLSRDERRAKSPHILDLKYYVMLIIRRDLYPKSAIELKEDRFRPVSTVSRQSSQHGSSEREPEMLTSIPEAKKGSGSDTKGSERSGHKEDKSEKINAKPGGILVGIRQESINYLGYYSGHEQQLQAAIQEHARNFEFILKTELKSARVHCRRDMLWQRLINSPGKEGEMRGKEAGLSFTEFQELLSLSEQVELDSFDPSLKHFLIQPYQFYHGLSKMIQNRFGDRHRLYTAESVQYTVLLSQKDQNRHTCIVIAIDSKRPTIFNLSRDSEGEIAVMKENLLKMSQRDGLIEEFVNLCCFQTWTEFLG